MRSGARRLDRDDPEPGPDRDLAAEAAVLMDRAAGLIGALAGDPACQRTVMELAVAGIRMAELTAAVRDAAAGQAVVEAAHAAGMAAGEARAAARMRGGRVRSRRSPGPGQAPLFPRLVQGLAVPAALGAVRSWPARAVLAGHHAAALGLAFRFRW